MRKKAPRRSHGNFSNKKKLWLQNGGARDPRSAAIARLFWKVAVARRRRRICAVFELDEAGIGLLALYLVRQNPIS